MDVRHILWTGDDIYRSRYENAAAALVAIQSTLGKNRSLGASEDEFLELYEIIASADPEIFTKIWEDPFSYFWVRRAYELLRLCAKPGQAPFELRRYCLAIGANNPREALALHLQDFKRLVIALEMMTGGSRRFRSALTCTLPLSIPGTPYSLVGNGRARILGVAATGLELDDGSRTLMLEAGSKTSGSSAPRLIERPTIRYRALEVVLKPETFCLPSVAAADALFAVPEEFQAQQIGMLQQGLALVERHQPDTFQQFGELIKVIALKPPTSGEYSNMSLSDLPAAFILSAVQDPYWIADSLIHEFFHNRLFFIADEEPIFADPEPDADSDQPGGFYSPWRYDLRPLTGLLHALYVYTGVCKYWFSVWQSGETQGPRRAYVEDQSVRWMSAIRIGVEQLRRHARFTRFGAALFKEMECEADSLWQRSRALGLSPTAPAMLIKPNGDFVAGDFDTAGRPLSIIDTIRQHQERYDKHGQCPDLDSMLLELAR